MAVPMRVPTAERRKHTERARLQLLAKTLKLRLSYARLKVQHGWHRQTLNEVENLYFRHFRTQSLAREAERVKKEVEVGRRRGSIRAAAEAVDQDDEEEAVEATSEVSPPQVGLEGQDLMSPPLLDPSRTTHPHPPQTSVPTTHPSPLAPSHAVFASPSSTASPSRPYPSTTTSTSSHHAPIPSSSTATAIQSPGVSASASAGGAPRTYEDFWKNRSSPSRLNVSAAVSPSTQIPAHVTGGGGARSRPPSTGAALSAATGGSGPFVVPGPFPSSSMTTTAMTGSNPEATGQARTRGVPPTAGQAARVGPLARSSAAAGGGGHASQASVDETVEISLDDIDQMNWTS